MPDMEVPTTLRILMFVAVGYFESCNFSCERCDEIESSFSACEFSLVILLRTDC